MKFFEPEDEYKTEQGNEKNIKTKINFLVGIIVFGSLLILAVQIDFLKFFGKEPISETCVYNNTYNRVDDKVIKIEKAQKALRDHLETISELDGYSDSFVNLEETEIKDHQRPVIYLYFDRGSNGKNRIPKTICGNQVTVKLK